MSILLNRKSLSSAHKFVGFAEGSDGEIDCTEKCDCEGNSEGERVQQFL